MTSDEPVLCRLEVVGADAPYRGTRLEARPLGAGFSVWFWNDNLHRHGLKIGTTTEPYNARALAKIILDYGLHWRLYSRLLPGDLSRTVSVTGERGIKALLLQLAFARGHPDCAWIMSLPDATLDTFDAFAGDAFGDDGWDLAFYIVTDASYPGLDLDVPALLRRYGLAADTAGPRGLRDALARDQKQRAEQRLASLAPFADRIEWMTRAFEWSLLPYSNQSTAPSKIGSLRYCLQEHAHEHGRLPTGRAWIASSPGGFGHTGFEVDFDALTAEAARACARLPLPESYRLPRHKREPFFRPQIEAIITCVMASLDCMPRCARLEPALRQFRVTSFLEHYVNEYERLPHGTMRADSSHFPLTGLCDLGKIDFDALLAAAGVSSHNHDRRDDPRLAPLEDQIEWMGRALDMSLRRDRSGHPGDALDQIRSLKRTLTEGTLAHGRLPTGKARLPIDRKRPLDEHNMFEVDLDALAADVASARARLPLPKSYRWPRRQRTAFFRSRITAIIYELGSFTYARTPGAAMRHGGFRYVDMQYFLEDYVADYERLPRGTMQADGSQLPLLHQPHSLGEIDFDKLRRDAIVHERRRRNRSLP